MSPTGWILFVIVGFVYRTNGESLRGALNALTRDYNSRELYNNLPSFKYRGDNDDFDEDEEELEFLPLENQIEPVGDGYRNLNEKLLERALEDYVKTESAQEEVVPSLFREREIKRGIRNEQPNVELARLFLDELYGPYNQDEMDDNEYNTLRMLHRPQQDNQYYGNDGLITWGDVLEKKPRYRDESEVVEFPERDSDLYLMPMERRNVNARDFRNYHEMSKRFPLAVAKRSAKAVNQMKQVTDPKVAHDLGILFGTQSTENKNHTHEHANHEQNNQIHQHGKSELTGQNQETTSLPSIVNSHQNGQQENITKTNQSKERPIEVKKKSVNWSDYFGIDRRKKKSTFMPKPGSQNQDDEWFLERYYKTMADNLKSDNGKDIDERKDKLQQMESRLRHIKDLILQEALNVEGSEKEKVMSRLAAAYSLDKMRKALKEFRDAVAQKENQKLAQDEDNMLTTSPPEGVPHEKIDNKRRPIIAENEEGFDEGNSCPELEVIDMHCRMSGLRMSHDLRNILHDSCVSTLICRSCGGEDCLNKFAFEVEKVCRDIQQSIWSKEQCLEAARLLPINPPATLVALCHSEGRDSCLIRNYYHNNRQRNVYSHDINHRFGYDNMQR